MKSAISIGAAMLVVADPAVARDKAALDPTSAYVLVDVGTIDDAAWQGTHLPGSLTIAPYDRTAQAIVDGDDAKRIVLSNKPVSKSKLVRQFLVPVTPGTWVIEGASGTAFALGSRTFNVGPGQIIDLGVVKPVVDWAEGEAPKSMAKGLMGAMLFGRVGPKEVRPVRLDWHARAPTDLAVPVALAGRPAVAVTFQDGATFDNHLGGLVNRVGGRHARATDAPPTP